jgi:hypothetical protein
MFERRGIFRFFVTQNTMSERQRYFRSHPFRRFVHGPGAEGSNAIVKYCAPRSPSGS